MRENEPVLLVLSTYDGKLFLRKVKFYLRNVRVVSRLWSVPTVQACAPLNRAVVFFGSSLTTNAKRRLPIPDNDGPKKGTWTGMWSALKEGPETAQLPQR